MKYEIISAFDETELEKLVNSAMKNGASPVGGLCRGTSLFLQAVIFEDISIRDQFRDQLDSMERSICNRLADIESAVIRS